MEPYLVRRLSSRSIQLPPLAFRQLEQTDLRSESENIPRPTSLPLKILPLIAITSADSSGWVSTFSDISTLYTFHGDCYMWFLGGFCLWPIVWFEEDNKFLNQEQKKKTVKGFLRVTSVSTGGGIWHKCFAGRCWKVAMTVHKNPGKRYCTRKSYTGHKWFLKFLTNDNSCIHYHVGRHVQKQ